MEPLVYHMPRIKLLARLAVIVVVTGLATCLAFWVNPGIPLNGTLDPEVVPYLRGFGSIVMCLGCYAAGTVLEAIFWPQPVLRVDDEGITVQGATVPWEDFRGVAVRSLRVNFLPVQRNLDIKTHTRHGLFKRKRLSSNWVPGNALAIAKDIAAFDEAREASPDTQAVVRPENTQRRKPRRAVVARRIRQPEAVA